MTAFEKVSDFAATGKTKWSKRKQNGTTLTRSGLPPLDEPTLTSLWNRRADRVCHAEGVVGITAWIEQKVAQRFNQVTETRYGIDIDDMCLRALEIGFSMWGPPGADWVPEPTYLDEQGQQHDTDIVNYTLDTICRELPHIVEAYRDYAVGRAVDGVVRGGHKPIGPGDLELPDPLVEGRQDEIDTKELIRYLAPALGNRPDAAEVLYNARLNGKELNEIAETLGVPKRTLSKAISKWGQAVYAVLGRRWKIEKK
jgi:hypothetical protein